MPFAYRMKQKYCYSDYLKWDDGERWELINGMAFCMSPAPSPEHQSISMALSSLIYNHLQKKTCKVFAAPFDVRLPQNNETDDDKINTVVQPDIVIICDKNKIDKKGCLGAPDFIAEILSPYTTDRDMRDKFYLYEKSGVREYWIIDPGNKTIHAYTLESVTYSPASIYFETDNIESVVLPGFIIRLGDIFG